LFFRNLLAPQCEAIQNQAADFFLYLVFKEPALVEERELSTLCRFGLGRQGQRHNFLRHSQTFGSVRAAYWAVFACSQGACRANPAGASPETCSVRQELRRIVPAPRLVNPRDELLREFHLGIDLGALPATAISSTSKSVPLPPARLSATRRQGRRKIDRAGPPVNPSSYLFLILGAFRLARSVAKPLILRELALREGRAPASGFDPPPRRLPEASLDAEDSGRFMREQSGAGPGRAQALGAAGLCRFASRPARVTGAARSRGPSPETIGARSERPGREQRGLPSAPRGGSPRSRPAPARRTRGLPPP